MGRTFRGIWACLLVASLAACGPTLTLAEAIRQVHSELRVEHVVEVLRTDVNGETVVLQTATAGCPIVSW